MLLWLDSCGDSYTTSTIFTKWIGGGDPNWTVVQKGRTGSNCLQSSTLHFNTPYPQWFITNNLSSALRTIIVGTAILLPTQENTIMQPLIRIANSGVPYFVVGSLGNGSIFLTVGKDINPQNSSNTPNPDYVSPPNLIRWGTQSWMYLEIKATFSTNNQKGTLDVRVNEQLVWGMDPVSVNGINNYSFPVHSPQASDGVNQVSLCSGAYGNILYDDVYIDTANFRKDIVVFSLSVSSSGASGMWQSFGPQDSYQALRNIPPSGDLSYIYSGNPGDISTFKLSSLANKITAIDGVQTVINARKDDSGARFISPTISASGITSKGSTISLSSGYEFYNQGFDNNPITSTTWTLNDLVTTEIGVIVDS